MSRLLLVTGAAGSIGQSVVDRAGEHGFDVRALVHARRVGGAAERVHGDLLDPPSLARAVAGADCILHLAAVTHARRAAAYERLNVDGTRALVQACEGAGVRRLVHVSTRAIDERGGAYSRSKRRAEEVVRTSGLEWVVVRLPDVVGAGGREGVDALVAAARRGGRVPVVGRGEDELCPVHLEDAVGALLAALDAPAAARRTYTLAGECVQAGELVWRLGGRPVGVPVPLVGLACAAARLLPLPLYPDQLARLRAPKPPASPEAAGDLGFRPRPLADVLAAADGGRER